MARQEKEKKLKRLLPLYSDIVFRMVFGDREYISVLRAFLSSALGIPKEHFDGVEIIDPHLERDRADDKLGILDVRVQLADKTLIAVEIQVEGTPSMRERVAFSTGRNLSRQIKRGEDYGKIARVATIVITKYDIIKEDNCYHHIFRLYDGDKKVLFTDIMEIHTLEMAKLPEAGADDKELELLGWLRMIKSDIREDIEMLATKTPEMGAAVARLKQLSEDERVQMIYESQELARMDESVRRKAAFADGLSKGRIDGIADGKREMAFEIAKSLLADGISPEAVARNTGLSAEDVRFLAD
jgi:predicted transposase/invertase (TIGR01784 family)